MRVYGIPYHDTSYKRARCIRMRGLFISKSAVWASLPLSFYAETRGAPSRALAANIAARCGLGKGEFSE